MQLGMPVVILKGFDSHTTGAIVTMPYTDAAFAIGTGVARPLTDQEEAKRKDLAHITSIHQAIAEQNAKQAPLSPKYDKSFAHFLHAVWRRDNNKLKAIYNSELIVPDIQAKSPMSVSSGVAGGYTVPPEFQISLRAIAAEQTFLRRLATVVPMSSQTRQLPMPDLATVQAAGTPPFFGGVTFNWLEDGQAIPETEPKLQMAELKAHVLAGVAYLSRPLLDDAGPDGNNFLLNLFGQALAWFEEYAFLQGNGVGKPTGILNAGATINVTRQTANTITYSDVVTMFSKLIPFSYKKAVWAFSPSALVPLLQLKDGSARAVMLQTASGAATPYTQFSILGRPAFCTEKLPALGTAGDLILLDPTLYLIGDHGPILLAASDAPKFTTNQITWRILELVDGQCWPGASLTLQDGSTTASPFVALK
jgi:HK97 family phage major capsid protein